MAPNVDLSFVVNSLKHKYVEIFQKNVKGNYMSGVKKKTIYQGVLIETGVAPFEFKEKNGNSPFARIRPDGGRETGEDDDLAWGVDVPRSIKESGVAINGIVTMECSDKVQILVTEVINGKSVETIKHRNVWLTKKVEEKELTVCLGSIKELAAKVSSGDKLTELGSNKEIQALGMATITDVGEENVYIEKEGAKFYFKTGNTDAFKLGGTDFSAVRVYESTVVVEAAAVKTAGVEKVQAAEEYAVHAAYWLAGIHNAEGIKLANEMNKFIRDNQLTKDRDAILRLLAAQESARMLAVRIDTEQEHLKDVHWISNVAEPKHLLNGEFIRDEKGVYRGVNAGHAAVVDTNDKLVLKDKSAKGYAAIIELAHAKGWTAIELTGGQGQMAAAWTEAQMHTPPIQIVNYKPTEKDIKRLAVRIAEEAALKNGNVAEQEPDVVAQRAVDDGVETPVRKEPTLDSPKIETSLKHSGTVQDVKDGILKQNTGRGRFVYHDISKLDGDVPEVGKMALVQYGANGLGKVSEVEKSQGVSLG